VISDIQWLVDAVAADLDTSTVLEDAGQRMVAFSSQSPLIDDVRRDSVLRKETPQSIIDWFGQFGIHHSRVPVAIPGDEGLGILPRVCAPARYRDALLGFLWFIDANGRVARDGMEVAAKAAEHAALLMYEEELTSRLASGVLANLLSPSQELRESAAAQVLEESMFPARCSSTVVAVCPVDVTADPELSREVSESLVDFGRRLGRPDVLRMPRADHGVLLVPTGPNRPEQQVTEIADGARLALVRRLSRRGDVRVVAAIGDPQTRLAHAVSSYRQARLTARVAAVVPTFGDCPRWRDLGVFRTLALLPSEEAAELALDPRLRRLFDSGDQETITTLETYLDLGCDAKATYEQQHIHRATLYYRLHKVQKISGVDLTDGSDRLALHLGFKLSRLSGLHPLLRDRAL
jgi:hypothetical protein